MTTIIATPSKSAKKRKIGEVEPQVNAENKEDQALEQSETKKKILNPGVKSKSKEEVKAVLKNQIIEEEKQHSSIATASTAISESKPTEEVNNQKIK